jgi:LuxR family transcriptional regulator, maltose regulon positive regulatory protein
VPARGAVRRARLLDVLDRSVDHRLTAVVAPTGWGKSALLTAWAQARGAPLLSLRDEDADAWTFERDLAAAVEASPGPPPAIVIDDLQMLSGHGLAALRSLLRGPGPPLILASRCEPDIGLPRLRLEGEAQELRARDLAFTEDEAAQLLDLLGVPLAAAERARLLERTEGWAAGICLAAASLEHVDDAARLIDELSGSDAPVAEYLTDEVLAAVGDDVRDFLLRASVVDELCAELAAALTGRDDSGDVLDGLVRRGVPLEPLDRQRRWYRWHPLFAELLRARLAMHDRAVVPQLHLRAARWLADHGYSAHALIHAAQAVGERGGETLLAEYWLEQLLSDGGGQFPVSAAPADDDRLRMVAANRHLGRGDAASARRELDGLAHPTGDVERLARLLRARADDDVDAARAVAHDLLTLGPRRTAHDDDLVHAIVVFHLGLTEFACGSTAAAADRLNEAAVLAQARERTALLMACAGRQSALAVVRGRAPEALAAADAALGIATARGWRDSAAAAWARAAQAVVALWDGDVLEAERLTELAGTAAFACGDALASQAIRGVRAHVSAAAGDEAGAHSLMRIARAARSGPDTLLARWLDALGPTAWAPDPAPGAASALNRAMAEIASGDARAALKRSAAIAGGRDVHPVVLVEALMIEARARDVLGLSGAAHALGRARDVAKTSGYGRPLAAPSPDLARLLTKHALAVVADAAVEPPAAPDGLVDDHRAQAADVTERERAVLRLLATFLTTREIAAELHISVNTAKTHMRSLYRKLEASSRRDAVTRARELGWL